MVKLVSNSDHINLNEDYDEPVGFGSLQDLAYGRGYDLCVDKNFNITLKLLPGSSFVMPEITVKTIASTNSSGEKVYNFIPKLKFPDLEGDENSFPDTIESTLQVWSRVGTIITSLMNFTYNPLNYKE